jgi:hypothetical protein
MLWLPKMLQLSFPRASDQLGNVAGTEQIIAELQNMGQAG